MAWFYCACRHRAFHKWEVYGNPASSKSRGASFPPASAHFLSLIRMLVILTVFQHFHYYYMCYRDLRSVIFDVAVIILLGHHKPHP